MFQDRREFTSEETTKLGTEREEHIDVGEQCSDFPEKWKRLAERGYQGHTEIMKLVQP